MNENFESRWNESMILEALGSASEDGKLRSPFGLTETGLVDLRGISLQKHLDFHDLVIEGVDFSNSRFSVLRIERCQIKGCLFENVSCKLICVDSKMVNTSFSNADLSESVLNDDGCLEYCDFNRSVISGSTFRGEVKNSSFIGIRAKLVEFERGKIEGCVFDAKFERCFFRNDVLDCDFCDSVFLDTSLRGGTFKNCVLPKNVLFFQNWPEALRRIDRETAKATLSPKAQKLLGVLLEVWHEDVATMPQEIVDVGTLRMFMGKTEGLEAFDFLARFVR